MSRWRERQAQRSRQRKTARAAGLPAAPGDLEIVQAFVNTAACDRHPDRFASPEDLGHWLERRGLLAAGTVLEGSQWGRGLDLRRDLRALIRAGGKADDVDGKLLRDLERTSASGRLVVRFDDGGPSSFGPASGGFDDALAALVAIIALARIEGHWPYLGLCVRNGCGRAFFVEMRRSAKWCTPQCGERVRAARRRARKGR